MRSWAQVAAGSGRAAPGDSSSERRSRSNRRNLNVVPARHFRWLEETELWWDDPLEETSPLDSPGDAHSSWRRASPAPSHSPWDPAPPVHYPANNSTDLSHSVQIQPPTPPSTAQSAEEQSVDEAIALLELYMSPEMEQGEGRRQQLVEQAVEALKRQRGGRGRQGEGDVCVVCCEERANTVLIPCRHLVMCGTCCDRMEIKDRESWERAEVPCPICRTVVEDRIKIFRG